MQKRRIRRTPQNCFFCKQKTVPDYKDIETLAHYLSERGRVIARIDSGLCQKHQKETTIAIKRARYLALLPFIVRPS